MQHRQRSAGAHQPRHDGFHARRLCRTKRWRPGICRHTAKQFYVLLVYGRRIARRREYQRPHQQCRSVRRRSRCCGERSSLHGHHQQRAPFRLQAQRRRCSGLRRRSGRTGKPDGFFSSRRFQKRASTRGNCFATVRITARIRHRTRPHSPVAGNLVCDCLSFGTSPHHRRYRRRPQHKVVDRIRCR